MVVRRAVLEDIPWLVTELEDFAAHYPVRIPVPHDHAERLLGQLIDTQYVAIASTEDGTRVGLIAGVLQPHPFNPDVLCATQLWWWVTPEHRSSSAGARLLGDFERWAASTGADLTSFTVAANSPIHAESMTRRGWRPAEMVYVKGLAS